MDLYRLAIKSQLCTPTCDTDQHLCTSSLCSCCCDLSVFVTCVLQDLRLPSVTTIAIPAGYNWREMLAYIMKHHQMEMTGGLGPSIGMVSRCDPQSEQSVRLLKILMERKNNIFSFFSNKK